MSTHSEIPEDVAALITAHALGALEPDQAELAERHIAASDACRRAYEDALETSAALALAVADSEPPIDLRDRIVAAARAERSRNAPVRPLKAVAPRRRPRLAGLLTPSGGFALAGVAAAVVFALIAVSQHNSASSARDRQEALVSILSAKDARVVPLASSTGGQASGRVIVSQGRAALISSLGAAPSGRTYQAWGFPAGGGKPVPLPTFSRKGAVVILNGVGSYTKLAVTVEPSGGSQVPSSAPVAAASL
jgi:anti-sigma-K factor RskA